MSISSARSARMSDQNVEIRQLTGLRWFAAMLVLLLHFHENIPQDPRASLPWWINALLANGRSGVDVFFALSGFVLAYTYVHRFRGRWSSRLVRDYLVARIARIWPLFFGLSLAYVGLISLVVRIQPDTNAATHGPEVTWQSLLKHLFIIQIWDSPTGYGKSWLNPGWSLSAEWLAYLVFTVGTVALWHLRVLPAWALGVLAFLSAAPYGSAVLESSHHYPYSWVVRVLGGFYAGAFTYLALEKWGFPRRRSSWGGPMFLLGVLIWVAFNLFLSPQGQRDQAVVLLMPLLLAALAMDNGPVAKVFGSTVLVHGGRISFAIYLIHFAVMTTGISVLRRLGLWQDQSDWWIVILSFTLLSHLLAEIAWRWFEVPVHRWIRGRFSGVRRSASLGD